MKKTKNLFESIRDDIPTLIHKLYINSIELKYLTDQEHTSGKEFNKKIKNRTKLYTQLKKWME